VTRLNLLLSLKMPELELAGTNNNIVCDWTELQSVQDVVRSVFDLVTYCLNACVRLNVPDFHHLIA